MGALLLAPAAHAVITPTDCPDANCTANDLVVGVLAQAHASDATCSGPSDTVNVQITHTLQAQGDGSRYDIGLYTTTNPGGSPDCQVDILEPASASGFTNIDPDECGDVDGDDVVTHTNVYTVPCLDFDSDGQLDDIVIWQSWTNNPDQIDGGLTCNESNVIEGTAAKCRTQVAVGGVDVPDDPGVCGDGQLNSGEQCDDGNLINGDGCSSRCLIEVPTVNEWGLGLLSLLLLGAGALAVRKGNLV